MKNTKRSAGSRLYWAVGMLLVLVMLTTWMVCGLFAKYITTNQDDDTARVAATGVKVFTVLEHEAVPDVSDVYSLGSSEVTGNDYEIIPPGFDIPKDPFVRVELENSEVDYYLYVQVIKSEHFPEDLVSVLVDDANWKVFDAANNIYQYTGYFDAGTHTKEIPILKGDKIYISQYYDGTPFSVSFQAWLKQVD